MDAALRDGVAGTPRLEAWGSALLPEYRSLPPNEATFADPHWLMSDPLSRPANDPTRWSSASLLDPQSSPQYPFGSPTMNAALGDGVAGAPRLEA
jgi:hypothetical protein